MIELKLEYNLSELQNLQNALKQIGISGDTLPNTSAAVHSSARYVSNLWGKYLYGEGTLDGLDSIEKPMKPETVNMKVNDTDAFHSVVSTDSDKVSGIQHGTNPVFYDMKETHPYGRKSRVSNDGIPYLIIPFRWGTPNNKGTKRRWNNVIPQREYRTFVTSMELSKVKKRDPNNPRMEENAKGELIERARYKWKTRLSEDDAWDERSVGMVRMKDVRKSTYFTFRVISAKSPANKWLYWKDGKSGVDMLGALERTARPEVERRIEAGVLTDLQILD